MVWSARYRPFGEASIGAGYVTQNLRFPGQYYDEESGLHYNYHRYYDPSIGRYITSDPIGLQGGINTYSYALQNPIIYIDPTGEAVPLVVAGGCVAGSLGAIFTGQSFSNIALTCSLGAIGTVGAAATASATAARIIAGLAGAAAGGLGAVSDAQGAPAPVVPVPNVIAPLPNFGSPDPLDDAITEAFCQQNPDAPNCKEDEPDDCE